MRIVKVPGHTDEVTQLEWVPGSSLLLSGGADGVAMVLDCARLHDAGAPPPAAVATLAVAKGGPVDALATAAPCPWGALEAEGAAASRLHIFIGSGEHVHGYDVLVAAPPAEQAAGSSAAPRMTPSCSWHYNRETVAALSVTASSCAGSAAGTHTCSVEVTAGDDDGDIAVVSGLPAAPKPPASSSKKGGKKGGKKKKPGSAAGATEKDADSAGEGADAAETAPSPCSRPSCLADREWTFTRALRRGHSSLCGGILSVEVALLGAAGDATTARLMVTGGFDQRIKVWAAPGAGAGELKWRALAVADPTKIEAAAAGASGGAGAVPKAKAASPVAGAAGSPLLLELSPALLSNGYVASAIPAPPVADPDYEAILDPAGIVAAEGGKIGNPPIYHALAAAPSAGWKLQQGGAVFAAAIGDGSIALYGLRAVAVTTPGAETAAAAAGLVRLGICRDAHAAAASCVAFVPCPATGRRLLVSGGNDGRVKLWEVVATPATHSDELAFSPDSVSFKLLFSSHHSKRGPNALAAFPLASSPASGFAVAVADTRKDVVLYVWDEAPPAPAP